MRRYLGPMLVVSLVLSLLVIGRAQTRVGQINGVVTDSSGAVLPGVTVTIAGGGTSRTAITNEKGAFVVLNLAPGPYTIVAALSGFEIVRLERIEVVADQSSKLSIALRVGALEETVTVSGATPTVDAQSNTKSARKDAGVMRAAPAQPQTFIGRPFAPANAEAYDTIDDNKWTEVSQKPLSTFSIDVDTASYSNVRRFLNQGQMPPKDAVRIEEMINYFSYNYPAPTGGAPFSVTTAMDVCPWNPGHRLALVGLQGRRIDAAHMPPRNLVFLIDVSGSMMMPQKLPLVKASLAMLAPNLTARDHVAIVVYAGRAGLVLPPTSGADTSSILDAVARLEAGGSTNGGQGLLLAYKVAEEQFVKGGVNRVLLATDGDFNVGVTNQNDLVRLIEEKRDGGVTLSVLGFGMGNLKDSTMEKLADKGNGNYFYIDSLAEAQKVLVQQAGGTLVTVAKDVKLQVEFNPQNVSSYRLIGYEDRILQDRDFNDDRKDAGDMGAGHSVTALYELVPEGAGNSPGVDPLKYQQQLQQLQQPRMNPRVPFSNEALTVKLRYKQPDGDVSSLMSVVVGNNVRETPELGFASAVAEFGMLLRDSEFKGTASFADVRTRATRYQGDDPHGHRAEFLSLVDAAEGVSRVAGYRR